MLKDSFGRKLDYLRVSVTDRCNLRCVYCMPSSGVVWKPHDSMLSFEEILRLCRILTKLGIRKIRVTGGEPLVRRGINSFLLSLKTLSGLESLTLTTNGFLLADYLEEIESVLDGVNISLDALEPGMFKAITRCLKSEPGEIIKLVNRLLEKNIPVKINCVPIRGLNEGEILPLAALARDRNIAVRFIELMPLGAGATLEPVSGVEVAALLEKAYGGLTPSNLDLGSGPALYYSLPGFRGKIGFINPISQGFCESCNRLRLSSEGLLRPCLADERALDLRELLRGGSSDQEIRALIVEAAAKKPRFHTLSGVYGAPLEEVGGPQTSGMFRTGG